MKLETPQSYILSVSQCSDISQGCTEPVFTTEVGTEWALIVWKATSGIFGGFLGLLLQRCS